jgi:hypothetical protein
VNRTTVEIPGHQVDAIRRGLLASHEAIAEEVELVGREQSQGDATAAGELAGLQQQLLALEQLIEQLPASGAVGHQTVTGAREPLRIAACDALVSTIEELGSHAHDYWRQERTLDQLGCSLEATREYLVLLGHIEHEPAPAG